MVKHPDPSLRKRLLDAATGVFAEQGFAGASMAAIGAAAGVSKGGVYFHFRHKEELFFTVLDHWREALRRELLVAPPWQKTAVSEGEQSIWGYVDRHSVAPGESFRLMLCAHPGNDPVDGHIEIHRIGCEETG